MATVLLSVVWSSAAMAQPRPTEVLRQICPDTFADVYFMPDAEKYPNGLSPEVIAGLPQQHLHLPRNMLELILDPHKSVKIYPYRLCDIDAFAAFLISYGSTRDLAERLSMDYASRVPFGDTMDISSGFGQLDSFDDSADREAAARNGEWIFDEARGRGAATYWFCERPVPPTPSIQAGCYMVTGANLFGYVSGTFGFTSTPFNLTTFYNDDARIGGVFKLKTLDDVKNYAAFLRNLASIIIVN